MKNKVKSPDTGEIIATTFNLTLSHANKDVFKEVLNYLHKEAYTFCYEWDFDINHKYCLTIRGTCANYLAEIARLLGDFSDDWEEAYEKD